MTKWIIEIDIDLASEPTLAETEKYIDEFINDLPGFEYCELNINQLNKSKIFKLKSVNNI